MKNKSMNLDKCTDQLKVPTEMTEYKCASCQHEEQWYFFFFFLEMKFISESYKC
jgi:hypothetical protein